MSRASQPLPAIPLAGSLDDVIDGIDTVIQWSIGASSRLGYFAALYKRITIAVKVAVQQGQFEDGPRMENFDVAFANRYLAGLNAYFHPDQFGKPTRSWRTTFDRAGDAEPIILQHMLSGINTHISLDLGIAAQTVGGTSNINALREDFNRINAVLASQVSGILEDLNELSPALADIYAVLRDNQIFVINEAVKTLRDSAWRFATVLALQPGFLRPITIWARDRGVSQQNELVFEPPGVVGLIQWAIQAVAARESRDVVRNIQVLNEIASTPAPIATSI